MKVFEQIKKYFSRVNSSYLLISILSVFLLVLNIVIEGENQFTVLSKQFLHAQLNLPSVTSDAVLFKGLYYWHLGPFPAILLMPLSFITLQLWNWPIPQGLANISLVVVIFFLACKIAQKYGFDKNDSIWVSIAIVFSSVFCLSAFLPWSWHFSQTVTFFLGLLSLWEYLGKKNYFLIGLYHGLMFMTRFTAGFGILFYLLSVVFSGESIKKYSKKIFLMLIPIIFSGVFLLWYNYARFGDSFDNGYRTSNNWMGPSEIFRYEMLNYGLFDLKNIPTNLYYYFVNMPAPVLETFPSFYREIFRTDTTMIIHIVYPFIKVKTPGVSFFVTSIIFLLMFRNKLTSKDSKFAALTGGFIMLFLLTYYWTGWTQVGPRYMIDLLPFIFVIFLESYKEKRVLSWQKVIITFGAFLNLYLFFSLLS